MNPRTFSDDPKFIPFLYVLNQLLLKTSAVTVLNSLLFLITNDTLHLLPYDRACLFDLSGAQPKLVSISGQSEVSDTAPLVLQFEALAQAISTVPEPLALLEEHFPLSERERWRDLQKQNPAAVYWLPIYYDKKIILGLWLEQWGRHAFQMPITPLEPLLKDFLLPAYGIAWTRVAPRLSLKGAIAKNPKRAYLFSLALLAALFFIHLPLRIVAPCELISSNPYPIRAPLDGVIREIVVKTGQRVKTKDLLIQYESQAQLASLHSAEKQLLAKRLEVQRAAVLGSDDEQLKNELGILEAQKQKEEASLDFVRYEAGRLNVESPTDGIVVIDTPWDWIGRPVKAGEKILTVSDPDHTRVKIWIPDSDNVPLDTRKPIKIFLNTSPTHSYSAQIEYISNESTINERETPSFVAMADWINGPPPETKLGLKGSAVLYGESVSLIYYLLRRPWFALRNLIGM